MSLVDLANKYIKGPEGTKEIKHSNGDSQDIISVIMEEDRLAAESTKLFAPYFSKSLNGLKSLWSFVRFQIDYVGDPNGNEKIKSPSVTWKDRYADCKSMSVFIASILQNLRIPYVYRFVGYAKDKNVSHVYIVATLFNQEVILDAVHTSFNEELEYKFAYDYQNVDGTVIHKKVSNSNSGISGLPFNNPLWIIGLAITGMITYKYLKAA